MEILVAFLIQWLSLNVNLDIEEPPKVLVIPQQEIVDMLGANAHAIYHTKTRLIYLSDDVDVGSIIGASFLLHELVHHYQTEQGLAYKCKQAAERLAYSVQNKFVNAMKSPTIPDLDLLRVARLTTCPEDFVDPLGR